MPVVPKKIPDKIQWYQQRQADWTTNATAIGLSAAEMTSMSAKITAASAALTAHNDAKQAAKNATVALHDAVRAMGDFGSSLLKQIRAQAEQDGAQVYVLSSVPPPATPAPKGPPGQPTELVVTLTQTGALDMKWRCVNPPNTQGTTYNIFRRVGDVGEYTYVGGTGVREFTDDSAPGGAPLLMYKIQAVRSTAVGPFATFNVFLGVSSVGAAMIKSVVETSPTSPKMAA